LGLNRGTAPKTKPLNPQGYRIWIFLHHSLDCHPNGLRDACAERADPGPIIPVLNAVGGGAIFSYQNNRLTGNVTDGAPNAVLAVK
jgi:hypothetical protein